MRARTPEPMAMDDADAVAAFDAVHPVLQAPHHRSNVTALGDLLPPGGTLLDLGSGSARLLLELAAARPDVRIVGVELSEAMLAAGRAAIEAGNVADRVALRRGDMTALDGTVPARVDVVSCVWALHHLPDEAAALACLREIARVHETHGAAVWIFDFARLPDGAPFEAAIRSVPDVPPRLLADGLASEAAAWTVDELRTLLREAGMADAQGGVHPERPYLQRWSLA